MPLSAHGLHRPVGDGLLTSLAFGKDHVCVAFLTKSLTLVFVVGNIVGGEIQAATTTTKMMWMPSPIQCSDAILSRGKIHFKIQFCILISHLCNVVVTLCTFGDKLGLVMFFAVQVVIFGENRYVFQATLTSGTIKAGVFTINSVFRSHCSTCNFLLTDCTSVLFFLQTHLV